MITPPSVYAKLETFLQPYSLAVTIALVIIAAICLYLAFFQSSTVARSAFVLWLVMP